MDNNGSFLLRIFIYFVMNNTIINALVRVGGDVVVLCSCSGGSAVIERVVRLHCRQSSFFLLFDLPLLTYSLNLSGDRPLKLPSCRSREPTRRIIYFLVYFFFSFPLFLFLFLFSFFMSGREGQRAMCYVPEEKVYNKQADCNR